jgi:DNA-binding PadR family transcriptional regulator
VVTSTAACVLGILQMGPAPGQPGFREGHAMTGGQVYAAAERSVSRFWNLTRSQVYAELARLETQGLVVAVGEAGDRGAQPYAVSEDGRAAFRAWMRDFVGRGPRDDQLRSPLLLAVFFGHFVEPDRLRVLLTEYKAGQERSLALANDMLAALGDDRSLPAAALDRRARYARMTVDWLDDTITRVEAVPADAPTQPRRARRRR